MAVRKNDIVNGTILDINDDGQGVLKTIDGAVIFVPNALPTEEISTQIINTKSKFIIGKNIDTKKACEHRISPACPYYNKCGGCDIMHASNTFQKDFKTNKIKRILKKFANIEFDVLPIISLNEWRYRNKIALPVSSNGSIGLYKKNSHNILPIEDCLITEDFNKFLIQIMNDYINHSKISCYNEETHSGQLKHIVARQIDDQILITLVVTKKEIPEKEYLINLLQMHFKNFGLNLNINTLHNNVILGDKWIPIIGPQELIANEYGINYPVSNGSFFQVNNKIKKAIYDYVLLNIENNSTVIDCYSGAGLLSGIISKKAKHCYGIEIVKSATKNAEVLKANNNLTNLTNINGDCVEILPNLVKNLDFNNLIVTLDPPRKGCDKVVLDSIKSANPNKIIYISCDPTTLARDIKILLESNYKLDSVQPFDMFPQTKHVETVAIISKI